MFSALYINSDELRQERFINILEEDPAAVYLDIGVGDGRFTQRCLERVRPRTAIGLDHKNSINSDLKIVTNAGEGFKLIIADIYNGLPLDSDSVDVATCSQVIEHLQNTDAFLAELYRILKPGGCAVISTENLSSWDDIIAITLGYRPFSYEYSYLRQVGNPFSPHNNQDRSPLYDSKSGRFYGHNKVFTVKAMRAILLLHGFEVINIYGAGYYPFPFKPLMRLFSRVDKLHSKFMIVKIKKKWIKDPPKMRDA